MKRRFFYFAESDSLMDSDNMSEEGIDAMLMQGADEVTKERFLELKKELQYYWLSDAGSLFNQFNGLGKKLNKVLDKVIYEKGVVQNEGYISAFDINNVKKRLDVLKKELLETTEETNKDIDLVFGAMVTKLNITNKEKIRKIIGEE